jgi:hypothetical protein
MEDDIDSDGQWLSMLVGGSWIMCWIMCQNTFEIVVGVVWLVVVCLKWWLALVRVMIGGVIVVVVDGGWSDDQ